MKARTFSGDALCREAWAAEGLSDKTINAYMTVLARCESWASERNRDLLELTATELRELSAGWPATRSSRIQLRVALGRYWAVQGLQAAPGAIRVPQKPRYACRALAEPEAANLAALAAREKGPAALAVCFGLYAGLRREEIAQLRWSQIDLEAAWMVVYGKGDTTAELPLHPVLTTKLSSYERCGPFLFPGSRRREHVAPATVWTWTRRLSIEALGFEVAPHRLRHTAIATVNDVTGDLRLAQAFARHISIETTVLYTRVERSRLKAGVAALDYKVRSA